jgi:hypothetical protein
VSIDGQRAVPPGFYRIRLALPGYEKKGDVKVSFIDTKGKTVHSLTGSGRPRRLKPLADDSNIAFFTYETSICGRKRCLKLTRKGFLDWEWGCTNTAGQVINCIDPQP